MKTLLTSCLALTLLLLPGCTTIQTGAIVTPTRVKAVAYLGTSLALQSHPEVIEEQSRGGDIEHGVFSLQFLHGQCDGVQAGV